MPRPHFALSLVVEGSPDQVWSRLWDLERHTAAVPLTTAWGGPLREGVHFVARTGVGRVGFDDVMVVREWDPPRHAVIEKVGRPLGGSIEVGLVPEGTGTLLRWQQEIQVRGLPSPLVRLGAPLARLGYRHTLRRIIG